MKQYRRIVILGTTGSGKTTLAKRLAWELKLPHIELDALFWERGWKKASKEVFRKRVDKASCKEIWISDGNHSIARDLLWKRAELVIWLDYSLMRILTHLLRRTLNNIREEVELWPGCKESWKQQLFSRQSIFLWALRSHYRKRWRYPKLFDLEEYSHLDVVRLRTPKELEYFLEMGSRLENDCGLELPDFS